jgi:hypothetical protein
MQKEADEFMTTAGLLYEGNRKKWRSILKNKGIEFNEDIYNDSILKTYDAILKKEVGSDYMGYWYKTFLNNSKRDLKYSYHNRDDSVDVIEYLKEFPYEEYKDKTDTIIEVLKMVRDSSTPRGFHLFLMYYMIPEMTYDELKKITGISDVKGIIMRIKDDICLTK